MATRMDAEEHQQSRRRSLWTYMAAFVFAVAAAFLLGTLTGGGDDGAQAELIPVLDAEFDFAGATRTWEESEGMGDPFDGATDAELVAMGRTACLRATDDGMNFDGMSDLFQTQPHQTYAVLAEAADKLCPSQGRALMLIMDE